LSDAKQRLDFLEMRAFFVVCLVILASCTPVAGLRGPGTADYVAVYSHPHKVLGTVKPWEILEFEDPPFCVAAQTINSGLIQLSAENYENIIYVTLFAWHFTQAGSGSVFPINELWLDDGTRYETATIAEGQKFFAYPIHNESDLLQHLGSLPSDRGGLLVSSNGDSMRLSFGSLRELIGYMGYACSRRPESYMVALIP